MVVQRGWKRKSGLHGDARLNLAHVVQNYGGTADLDSVIDR